MECRECATPLDRPGDYCLVCRSANADTVVLDLARDRATVTALSTTAVGPDGARSDREGSVAGTPSDSATVLGERTVTTTPEDDDGEAGVVELRNFAGLIADEIRRKRPAEVYATGDRTVVRAVRAQVHYEFYRVEADDPVAAVIERGTQPGLEVVEGSAAAKLGGSHSTLIGERAGRRAIDTVADHPHVKKIIPGPIDASGSSSRGGVRAKATRADPNGNVRMLLRDGSSVQENRVVTTAGDRELGERIREDLNEALADAGLQGE
jgi:hypothetical protein